MTSPTSESLPSPHGCWPGDRAGRVREGKEDSVDDAPGLATQPLLKLS